MIKDRNKTKTRHKGGKSYQLTLKSEGDLYIMHITDGTYNTYHQLRSWQSFELDSFLNRCIDDFEQLKQTDMKTKEITVIPPEGYEIDEQNSTLQRIVFKEKVTAKLLPKTWWELVNIKGSFIDGSTSSVISIGSVRTLHQHRNVWPSEEEAKACLALAQLCQLRDRYNDGWKPDWRTTTEKYVIWIKDCAPIADRTLKVSSPLSFETEALRDEFLQNFRDLIEIARPLL